MKRLFWALVILVLLVGIPYLPTALWKLFESIYLARTPVATLSFGEDGRIHITAKRHRVFDDAPPELFYSIWKGDRLVTGPHAFAWSREEYRFDVMVLRGGTLITVYEQSEPHRLAFIYDAHSGECYPRMDLAEEIPWSAWERGNRLMDEVRKLTNDDRYRWLR